MKKSIILLAVTALLASCDAFTTPQQRSDSGVTKATTTVKTDINGRTIEQENIIKRLERDNKVGSIKHLYIISSYTGDVMEYSTVAGKVTSGGKRLSPKTVQGGNQRYGSNNYVTIGNDNYITDEVLDDGGAYGDSGSYMFWFDAQGNYHQYYPSGGTYVHISDKPLKVKKANFSVSMD